MAGLDGGQRHLPFVLDRPGSLVAPQDAGEHGPGQLARHESGRPPGPVPMAHGRRPGSRGRRVLRHERSGLDAVGSPAARRPSGTPMPRSAPPRWTRPPRSPKCRRTSTPCTAAPSARAGFPGCLVNNSDRSMADFFMVDKDTQGRVFIAYNENSDLSLVVPDPPEYIGKPINAGHPASNRPEPVRDAGKPAAGSHAGQQSPSPAPRSRTGNACRVRRPRTASGQLDSDPSGDAPFPVVPVPSANHPALDILESSVGDDGTNLTFKVKLADLSPTALADALTTGGTPTWMVMWWQGRGGIGPDTMAQPFHSHWYMKWLGKRFRVRPGEQHRRPCPGGADAEVPDVLALRNRDGQRHGQRAHHQRASGEPRGPFLRRQAGPHQHLHAG